MWLTVNRWTCLQLILLVASLGLPGQVLSHAFWWFLRGINFVLADLSLLLIYSSSHKFNIKDNNVKIFCNFLVLFTNYHKKSFIDTSWGCWYIIYSAQARAFAQVEKWYGCAMCIRECTCHFLTVTGIWNKCFCFWYSSHDW
jgi:hypothetical protein